MFDTVLNTPLIFYFFPNLMHNFEKEDILVNHKEERNISNAWCNVFQSYDNLLKRFAK